jgi:DNA-binding transcriptional regulator/RsmH inhibitor MraZ
MNILFTGTYQRKVDSKGRLSIPAEWRKYCDNTIFQYTFDYIFYSKIDDILNIAPQEVVLPLLKKHNLDPEGRIIIKSQIGKTATLKGCGDYFTIEFLD